MYLGMARLVSVLFKALGDGSREWLGPELRQRMQPSLREKLLKDDRQPILLIRSFKRDKLHLGKHNDPWTAHLIFHPDFYLAPIDPTFEETLVKRLDKIGPVVALGSPNEQERAIGAARDCVSATEWQTVVAALIQGARFVVGILDFSENLQWELEQVRQLRSPPELVIILPFWLIDSQQSAQWMDDYRKARRRLTFLPSIDDTTIAILYTSAGEAQLVRAASSNVLKKVDQIAEAVERTFA